MDKAFILLDIKIQIDPESLIIHSKIRNILL